MKTTHFILAACISAAFLTSCNQSQTTVQTKERTIEVSGTAEKEVVPDEVYFTITLQEYKKNGKKINLADMEKILLDRALKMDIKKEDLKLDNLTAYSYNYYYYGYGYSRKRDDVMATGTYRVKLKDTEQMDKLLENNEGLNVTYAYLSNFACSKKEKYNEELREKALKITKEKATKLLAAVGAELGEVISITDGGVVNSNNSYYPYGYYYGYGPAEERSANSVDMASASKSEPAVSPRNLKLRAEMKVVYRIK